MFKLVISAGISLNLLLPKSKFLSVLIAVIDDGIDVNPVPLRFNSSRSEKTTPSTVFKSFDSKLRLLRFLNSVKSFGTSVKSLLKKFIEHGHPGTYIKILEEGEVKKGDTLVLVEQSKNVAR